MDPLRDMALFVAVAKAKSFSRAAKDLDAPISSVSRRIGELEERVGVRLFNRTTRRVELTEPGRVYFERARPIVEAASTAHEELEEASTSPRGHLRVSMPADFGELFLTPLFADYANRYPKISFEFDLSPRLVDLVSENFDVAIRIGSQKDSVLATRTLTQARMFLVASAEYVQRFGEPSHPSDLAAHNCLRMVRAAGAGGTWVLHKGREKVSVNVTGRAAANNVSFLRRLAKLGMGVAVLDELLAVDDLAAGTLRRLLPEWSFSKEPICAVTPSKLLPAKTRLFLNCLRDHIDIARKKLPDA